MAPQVLFLFFLVFAVVLVANALHGTIRAAARAGALPCALCADVKEHDRGNDKNDHANNDDIAPIIT